MGRAFEFYSEMGHPRPVFDDNEWISSNGDYFRRLEASCEAEAIYNAKEIFFHDQTAANIEICEAIEESDKMAAESLIRAYWEHWPDENDRGFWSLDVIDDYHNWGIIWVGPMEAMLKHRVNNYVFKCRVDETNDSTDILLISPEESESPDIRETQIFTVTNLLPMVFQVFVVKLTNFNPKFD